MPGIRNRSEWVIRFARSPWSRLLTAVLIPTILVGFWLANPQDPLDSQTSSAWEPSEFAVGFTPTSVPARGRVSRPEIQQVAKAVPAQPTAPILPTTFTWHSNRAPAPASTSSATTRLPTVEFRSAARPTVAVNWTAPHQASVPVIHRAAPTGVDLPRVDSDNRLFALASCSHSAAPGQPRATGSESAVAFRVRSAQPHACPSCRGFRYQCHLGGQWLWQPDG